MLKSPGISLIQVRSNNPLHTTSGSTANLRPIVTLNEENIKMNGGVMALGIGRLPTNAIHIGLGQISRNHAEILYDTNTGKITLKDTNSTHGTVVFKDTDDDETKNTDNDIPVPIRCPADLNIKDKWEIVLAERYRKPNEKYHINSLVIQSDGNGNLRFHQIDPQTSKPGEALSKLILPLPNDTCAEQARSAANSGKVFAGLTDQESAGN
jgi:hypothetical protein